MISIQLDADTRLMAAEVVAINITIVSVGSKTGKSSLGWSMVGQSPDGPDLGETRHTVVAQREEMAGETSFEVTIVDTESMVSEELARLTGNTGLGVYDVLVVVVDPDAGETYGALGTAAEGWESARRKALAAEKRVLAAQGDQKDLVRARRLKPAFQRLLPVVVVVANVREGSGGDGEGLEGPLGDAWYAGLGPQGRREGGPAFRVVVGDVRENAVAGEVMDVALEEVWDVVGDFDRRKRPAKKGSALSLAPAQPPAAANTYPERNMNAPGQDVYAKQKGGGCAVS